VEEGWIDACLERKKRIRETNFILFNAAAAERTETQSTLDPRVQDLITLLFDESEMERALTEMSLDAKKLLSSVTDAQIRQAYSTLADLDGLVRAPPSAQQPAAAKAAFSLRLKDLSARFYQLIPHRDETPLTTPDSVSKKLKMMEAIRDVEAAARCLREGRAVASSANVIDVKYSMLKCKMEPVEKHSQEYSIIQQYLTNTHAAAHSNFKLEIESLFKVQREGEAERFAKYTRLPNRRLLWHGSRFTNFIGILTQGLRIAPPEAPVTGYFLGKGIYLADMASKSAEYCHASKEFPTGLMLLCESALGRWFQIAHGKYICREDLEGAGFHSTKGCGETAPDSSFDFTSPEGYIVPLGRESETGVLYSELPHNEFIVYDEAQVLIRYMLKVTFTFDDSRAVKI
jgi:poly [ADP-ribose] polymerase